MNKKSSPLESSFCLAYKDRRGSMSQYTVTGSAGSSGGSGCRSRPWVYAEHGAILAAILLNTLNAAQLGVSVRQRRG